MMKLVVALIAWFGQTAAPPVFEVASIKEAQPPSSLEHIQAGLFHVGVNVNRSRANYGFMSLADLIPYAYRVNRHQLSGPSWMNETRWDILALIPEGQPADRAPEMMQSLLAERFKLRIHRETREQSDYALVVGKSGLKIKEAAVQEEATAPPQPAGSRSPASDSSGMGAAGALNVRINNDGREVAISGGATGTMRLTLGPNGGMRMQMSKVTMAALADRLTQFMDRPVVDASELKGEYQVTLDLPVEAMRGMGFAQKLAALAGLGSFGVPEARALDMSGAAIIQAAKDLGLELQSRRAPIETIIVDRVEKTPTAN